VVPLRFKGSHTLGLLLLLLRWGKIMSLWDWASNGSIVHPSDDTWVNIEQRWKDIDRGKPKDSEKNLSQCHAVHHKSHMGWLGWKPGLRCEKPVTNHLSYGSALDQLCSEYNSTLTGTACSLPPLYCKSVRSIINSLGQPICQIAITEIVKIFTRNTYKSKKNCTHHNHC
jgi:hypothetical protein